MTHTPTLFSVNNVSFVICGSWRRWLLPIETVQSQHSLGTSLSLWRVSFPQQDRQRPSSDRSCSAGHAVQFHMPGPRHSTQDGWHALQIGSSLLSWEPPRSIPTPPPPRNRKVGYTARDPSLTSSPSPHCSCNSSSCHGVNKQNGVEEVAAKALCHLWDAVVSDETLGEADAAREPEAVVAGETVQGAFIWKDEISR